MSKTCYYEILGVDNNVSNDDLKRAYKKCALKWHPDKNIGTEDVAHTQFQLLQEAYNVLCDPQERAWYDKHKDQILSNSSDEDDCFNVFPYFTTSCFKGYGDDENGFYTVYGKVFQNIAEEDEAAVGRGKHNPPTFGNSMSTYPEIVELFYAHWSNYCTKKSYAWADDKISRDYGRKAIRLIDKENSKRREKLKKERNEEIRKLVSFVKKRDKRVAAWSDKMAKEKDEKLRRAEDLRKEQLLENVRQNEKYEECDWAKFSRLESDLADVENSINEQFNDKNSDSDYDDSEDSEAEGNRPKAMLCVPCHKLFQSEKAFINHEGSKKHKQNVALLEK